MVAARKLGWVLVVSGFAVVACGAYLRAAQWSALELCMIVGGMLELVVGAAIVLTKRQAGQ